MSQENVEVVRSIYEASNRRDWDAAFRDQESSVEVTTPPGIFAGTFRGREECQGFFEEMTGAFEEWSVHVEELVESDDQVAAVVRFRARPKGGGVEMEIRNGHLWTLRDGKAVSMQIFPKPQEALEAAGLSE
jgi:ketosteroid isomerase-like protein